MSRVSQRFMLSSSSSGRLGGGGETKETVLLTPLLPAELETVTVMVYLLPGSSPVIV